MDIPPKTISLPDISVIENEITILSSKPSKHNKPNTNTTRDNNHHSSPEQTSVHLQNQKHTMSPQLDPTDTNEMLESWAYFGSKNKNNKSKSKGLPNFQLSNHIDQVTSEDHYSSLSPFRRNKPPGHRHFKQNHPQSRKYQLTAPLQHKYHATTLVKSQKLSRKKAQKSQTKVVSPSSKKIDFLFSIFAPPQTTNPTKPITPGSKSKSKSSNSSILDHEPNSGFFHPNARDSGVKVTISPVSIPVPFLHINKSPKMPKDQNSTHSEQSVTKTRFTPPLQQPIISNKSVPLSDVGGKTITFKTKKNKRSQYSKPVCILCGFPGHLRQRCAYRQIADYYNSRPFQVTDYVDYEN